MNYQCIVNGRLFDTNANRLPFVSTVVICPACDGDDTRETGRCGDGCCVYYEECGFCDGEQSVEYSKACTYDADRSYWPSDN